MQKIGKREEKSDLIKNGNQHILQALRSFLKVAGEGEIFLSWGWHGESDRESGHPADSSVAFNTREHI